MLMIRMKQQRFELNGFDPEYSEGHFAGDSAEKTYVTQSLRMNEQFIQLLAEAHDSRLEYGKESAFKQECSEEGKLHDIDDWEAEPTVPVLRIVENDGEPGDDWIVIYNYKGVLRMTGVLADSHCHLYIYKVNETE
tara:strand:+ start:454 stop:861 length:408 start_codon:yes stop_codon:yes gene_type:complete